MQILFPIENDIFVVAACHSVAFVNFQVVQCDMKKRKQIQKYATLLYLAPMMHCMLVKEATMQATMKNTVNFTDGTWGINMNVDFGVEMSDTKKLTTDLPFDPKQAHVEPRDFVHSNKTNLVGVVLAVDEEVITVYIGNEVAIYHRVGSRFVRTWWDASKTTYSWEVVVVLRDE